MKSSRVCHWLLASKQIKQIAKAVGGDFRHKSKKVCYREWKNIIGFYHINICMKDSLFKWNNSTALLSFMGRINIFFCLQNFQLNQHLAGKVATYISVGFYRRRMKIAHCANGFWVCCHPAVRWRAIEGEKEEKNCTPCRQRKSLSRRMKSNP